MDIRILRYFLTVAQEGSFSQAAKTLYISQPTLSRQIHDLEEELGAQLFVRTNRNVCLTQEGWRLRRRAQEIVELMDMTEEEFAQPSEEICGSIYIGGGETRAMRTIAQVATAMQKEYPRIHFHLHSGNSDDVLERMERGLLDFGVLVDPVKLENRNSLRLPDKDVWGLLMRKDHPLSQTETIRREQLWDLPLIVSGQSKVAGDLAAWMGRNLNELNVVGTYNLVFNAGIMVEHGFGCAICLDHLVNMRDYSGLCFRRLEPALELNVHLTWKKSQVFSPAAEVFLQRMTQVCQDNLAKK